MKMVTCIYLLSGLCLWLGFKRNLYFSTCYLFLGYFFLVYFPWQISTSWKDYYLASFLLCFSLGSCFYFNLPTLFVNSDRSKNLVKKIIVGVCGFLFLLATSRIIYRWLPIQKNYVNIRLLLALNINYWEYLCFFKISLFILPLFSFSLRNKFFKIFFWLLSACVLCIPLHKSLVFFYCLVSFFSLFLMKNTNRLVLKCKTVFIFACIIYFFIWLIFCIFNQRFLPLSSVVSRTFTSVKKISYLGLDYAYKNKVYSCGASSFSKMYCLFSKNKVQQRLDKKILSLYAGVDESKISSGAGANTPTPIPLYVDFGWYALIFAFLLGMYLKTIDILMINFCSDNRITPLIAISYSCCLVGSSLFMITAMGTALLSGGILLYSVLLFLFMNLERKPKKES